MRKLLAGMTLVLLGLQVGGCQPCPGSLDCDWPPPDAGTTVDSPPVIPGCKGSCQASYQCPVGYSTQVRGRVTIPAGTLPLRGVQVAIPTGTALPAAPASGPSCGASADPALVTFSTQTDTYGNFILSNIPSGQNIPLIIRIGKWQRIITLPPIAG